MSFKIPKRFKLMGRTIDVEFVPNLDDTSGVIGRTYFRKNKLALQSSVKGFELEQDCLNETFLHELVHWIFFMISENKDLGSNEKLIDLIAGLLYQALTTMEYLED